MWESATTRPASRLFGLAMFPKISGSPASAAGGFSSATVVKEGSIRGSCAAGAEPVRTNVKSGATAAEISREPRSLPSPFNRMEVERNVVPAWVQIELEAHRNGHGPVEILNAVILLVAR